MRTFAVLAAAALLTACTGLAAPAAVAQTAPTAADAVIQSRLTIPDGDQPAIEAGVWSPAAPSPTPRPLIVISHGNGGDFRSHHDTAQALAEAGFVVATLTHTGDNWRDQSRATDILDRPRQLSVLIDYMLTDWDGRAGIDPDRVGAFGFSAGGFTVLAAAGGNPDLSRVIDHCRAHPDFYDCQLIARQSGGLHARVAGALDVLTRAAPHDPRIKALVVAAPALGFTFTRRGLEGVTQPVQLWRAEADQVLPSPFYVEPVRDALPRPPEYHQVPGAGHFDFLPPCSPQIAAAAPIICTPTPDFDRAAFHTRLNNEVVLFFQRQLGANN